MNVKTSTRSLPCALLAAGAMLSGACTPSGMFENIHVQPRTTLPIGNISASDSSLFDLAGIQDQMRAGADGVLTFVDSTSLTLSASDVGNSLVTVPNQTFTLPTVALPPLGGGPSVPLPALPPFSLSFNIPGGERVDSLIFDSGSLQLTIDGLTAVAGYSPSELVITLNSLTRNGAPVTVVSGQPLSLGPEYVFELTDNKFSFSISGNVPSSLGSISGTLDIQFGDPDYVAGFFGRKAISTITRQINAGSLNDFTHNADYVRFDDPQVSFELDNRYNAPMLLQIDYLRVDGAPVPLKDGVGGKLFYIAPQAHSRLMLSNANTLSGTGLSDMLTKEFSTLELSVNTILNPTTADMQGAAGFVEATHNSIHLSDTLGGSFAVVLPLNGVMDGISFDQEIEVDLSDLNKSDMEYEKMALTLAGTNDLPLDLEIMIYVNEAGYTLAQQRVPLFADPVLFPASPVNAKPGSAGFQPGTVDGSNLILRALDKQKIEKLLNADKMYLQLTASTLNAAGRQSVKIYTPSELKLRLTVSAELDYVLNAQ